MQLFTVNKKMGKYILQSMGASLTMKGTVLEASAMLSRHKCPDPTCDTILWKVRYKSIKTSQKIDQRNLVFSTNSNRIAQHWYEVENVFKMIYELKSDYLHCPVYYCVDK